MSITQDKVIEILVRTDDIVAELARIERYLYRGFTIAGTGIDRDFGAPYSVVVIRCAHDVDVTYQARRLMSGSFGVKVVAISADYLACDMVHGCKGEVTHIDKGGYAYCTGHGLARRQDQPCRKLHKFEINRLKRGEALARY